MGGFTPVSGLLGGILIGISAALLMLFEGRVAGISGIVGGLLRPLGWRGGWRAVFVAGLLAGGVIYEVFGGGMRVQLEASWPAMILAGLLVGFGTRLGSGCTSGHGVCGMARLSRRSISATLVFMVVAVITVFVTRHVL
ncbi:MAG: YeeE/YedE family protein [Rubrobacteraceae bacterium]|nr:YeeE/YedE family protein [Rubrobacteraceae bacterium]